MEKVLETTSTEEYNQWVAKNKNHLPGLRPILVDVEPYSIKSIEDTVNVEHKIYYYSESGRLLKKEIIRHPHTYFYIPLTLDRITITKSGGYKSGIKDEYTVKNSRGEIIHTPENWFHYIGMGKYVESHVTEDGDFPPGANARIFDEKGHQVGVIPDVAGIDESEMCITFDERYAVFRCHAFRSSPVVCVNNKGEVVWRKDFGPLIRRVFISADGTRIGIHHRNLISILNENGNLINTFNPFGQQSVSKWNLSPSGDYLVGSDISKYPKIIFYDVSTGKILWCDDSTLAKHNDLVKYLHIDINNRVIALCESHNLYIFNKNGRLEYKMNLNLGKEWHSIPAEKRSGIVYSKKVAITARAWFSELSGQYLIITLRRGSVNGIYSPVKRRIVYKIVEAKQGER